ncbi:hypothetical protein H4J51_10150 [Colwellia sp. MB02u-18]|uniref:hypothetical protein n=1 Tax=unclassified Colwellia TaxID=196834 RepID=UPI0015F533E2|nr:MULTISPECIES: hypothetical protein [unclassified Colwellia]MBA6223816.1 hypothetical protein [Colwellia sp. MB3u-45]MBA6267477.1 hypothetical protein [Colwellia sp. MB3u-43]MBA6319997.1 hypothetical protein [Colwellia sp. MB02u-19]MBA6324933.1 hypothetical protein [Colwellia sp. MB02u-18]MBA6330614.1 hypothetical protein [Colwellia sp. MB02u-12]
MHIKNLFKISTIAGALILTGCGGDINLSSDVDNSAGDNVINNPAPSTPINVALPGKTNSALSGQVSQVIGFDVNVQTLDGEISEDMTLVASTNGAPVFYAISGPLEVKAGATLSIEPGVVLFGQSGGDYLVVHRDAKIDASGTSTKPIIFTSLQDVIGETTAAGQWGGLVLLGSAPTNKCPTDDSACSLQVEGAKEGAVFGGTDWEDNSGILKYVVVKYAGFEIAPDNELNGITFGGVGSGTTVDYVQVHSNADDGVEFFGGAVQIKHLVLTANQDDSIDWDNGFRGKIQFAYIEQDKNSGPGNRGIEADNNGSNPSIEPQSNPTLSNLTIIGNNFKGTANDSEGIYLREGTAAKIFNTVVTGPSEMGECLEFEGGSTSSVTVDNANSAKIVMQNVVMACSNGENFKNSKAADGSVLLDLEAWFLAESSNSISTSILLDESGQPDSNSPLVGTGQNVANTQDGFFDSVDYIGAISSTNDWRQGWAFGFGGGVVTAAALVQGCPTGTTAISPIDGVTTTCQLTGHLTADLTLTAKNVYALNGPVFVGNDKADSAVLTIEAGTTIYGRSGADYLVVSRDSKIQANGSQSKPITFTSSEDLKGEATSAGQWGGLVLLGNAQSNKCPTDGSACSLQVEGAEEGAVFGGSDDSDSSGTLRYVVVNHAGFEIAPDNELNGITFGGVGSGTTVEYVQVNDNADDGVEFFGGTVNAKYLVLTSNQDDALDWDNGFRGNLQYVLVKANPDNGPANRGIEADNDGSNPSRLPQSNPTIANMTIIGNNFKGTSSDSEGVYLREGTKAQLFNFVVTGTADMGECFEIEGGNTSSVTVDQAVAGETVIANSVFACSENFKNAKEADGSVLLNTSDWVLNSNLDNSTAASMTDVVNGIFTTDTTTAKDFTGHAFFNNATHIGAVTADNDWTQGWTVGLE